MISQREAYHLSQILTGDFAGNLADISEEWREIAGLLIATPLDHRLDAWTTAIMAHPHRDAVISALASVDPTGPPLSDEKVSSTSTSTPPGRDHPALANGQPVMALDRGNFGTVIEDLDDRARVHFVNSTGHEATVTFLKKDLANPDGTPLGTTNESEDDWGPLRLGDVPPAEPFPDVVLPDQIYDFVRIVSASIGCPLDFVGLPVLVVAGAAIGRSVSLLLKPGYFASAAMYGMNVGGPSSGKSPALDAVSSPMWEIDRQLHDNYLRAKKSHEQRRKDKENPSKDEPLPTLESAVLEDCTVEAVAAHLALNPRGLLVSRDEGSAWTASIGQYKSGSKGADRQFWLSALYGKPIRVDRKGNPDLVPVRIQHPFLAVVGNIPPEMLSELRERGGRADGFIERVLFVVPEPLPRRHWSDDGIPDESKRDWAEIISRLRDRALAISPEGRAHPHVVTFTPEAKALWVDWYDAHIDETNAPGYDAGDLAVDGKLCDFAARIALILHLLHLACDPTRNPNDSIPSVPKWAVSGAICLWGYFRAHHRRARWFISGGIGNSNARSIVEWIKRKQLARFPESELSRSFPRFREDPSALAEALQWMTERNVIRREPEPSRLPGTRGRKPGMTWAVNPLLLAPDNCVNCLNSADETAQNSQDPHIPDDEINSSNKSNLPAPDGVEGSGDGTF